MSTGIITYHRAINYGAILQNYALQNYIYRYFDKEVYTIDYLSKKIADDYNNKFNLKTIVKNILVGKYENLTEKKFNQFIQNNIVLSEKCDNNSINKLGDKYNVYFTGSDQVWNYKGNGADDNYFLHFVKDVKKRNSYAASIGLSEIPEEYIDFYRNNISNINNISVREKSAIDTIKSIGIKKENIYNVLDPTLLLNKNNWLELLEKNNYTKYELPKRYILIYSFSLSNQLYDFAISLSEKYNLPIYMISNSARNWKKIKKVMGVGPLEFVDLFNNATYVLTNSFHGTAFSINLKKVFWVDLSTKLNSEVTSRITDLLNDLGMDNRISFNSDNDIIDYNEVDLRLEEKRKQSKIFLEKVYCNE